MDFGWFSYLVNLEVYGLGGVVNEVLFEGDDGYVFLVVVLLCLGDLGVCFCGKYGVCLWIEGYIGVVFGVGVEYVFLL